MFDRGVILWSWKFYVWQRTGFVVIEVWCLTEEWFCGHRSLMFDRGVVLWSWKLTNPLSNIKLSGPQNHFSVKHQTSMTRKPVLCQTSNFQEHKITPLSNIKLLWPQNHSFLKHQTSRTTKPLLCQTSNFYDHKTTPLSNIWKFWCLTVEWFCGPGSLMFDRGVVLWSWKFDVWQWTGFLVIEVWCLTEEWFCGPESLMFDRGLVLWS
jgi:hypothetical protein